MFDCDERFVRVLYSFDDALFDDVALKDFILSVLLGDSHLELVVRPIVHENVDDRALVMSVHTAETLDSSRTLCTSSLVNLSSLLVDQPVLPDDLSSKGLRDSD